MSWSEIRKDPLSDRWVIIAEDRYTRPNDYRIVPPPVIPRATRCPFCVGNEEDTPPTLATFPDADGTGWQVRVVPNKFPAVREPADAAPPVNGQAMVANGSPVETGEANGHSLFQKKPAFGEHEIIIESPRHVESLTQLSGDELCLAVRAYRDRLAWHRDRRRWKYAQLFKNVGALAGASLQHTHSQLVAMPMVPKRIAEELGFARRHWEKQRTCLFCEMLRQEQATAERIVSSGSRFSAFCPFASRFAYETWIVPHQHSSHFSELHDSDLEELAGLLQAVLKGVEKCCYQVGYNLLFHTAPFGDGPLDHYHWHIEVVPRMTTQAGFEWGSEYWINPLAPEQAADDLRRATVYNK